MHCLEAGAIAEMEACDRVKGLIALPFCLDQIACRQRSQLTGAWHPGIRPQFPGQPFREPGNGGERREGLEVRQLLPEHTDDALDEVGTEGNALETDMAVAERNRKSVV